VPGYHQVFLLVNNVGKIRYFGRKGVTGGRVGRKGVRGGRVSGGRVSGTLSRASHPLDSLFPFLLPLQKRVPDTLLP
jgi:hypothetical protein